MTTFVPSRGKKFPTTIPKRTAPNNDALMALGNDIIRYLEETAHWVTNTTEGTWTSTYNECRLNLFFNDRLVAVMQLEGHHTGYYLSLVVYDCFVRYEWLNDCPDPNASLLREVLANAFPHFTKVHIIAHHPDGWASNLFPDKIHHLRQLILRPRSANGEHHNVEIRDCQPSNHRDLRLLPTDQPDTLWTFFCFSHDGTNPGPFLQDWAQFMQTLCAQTTEDEPSPDSPTPFPSPEASPHSPNPTIHQVFARLHETCGLQIIHVPAQGLPVVHLSRTSVYISSLVVHTFEQYPNPFDEPSALAYTLQILRGLSTLDIADILISFRR